MVTAALSLAVVIAYYVLEGLGIGPMGEPTDIGTGLIPLAALITLVLSLVRLARARGG